MQNNLLSTLKAIVWKLNHNEMTPDNKCIPKKIDRNDIVIKDAIKMIAKCEIMELTPEQVRLLDL